VPGADPQSQDGLLGVDALPSGHPWAVGAATGTALTERWNGTDWVAVGAEDPGTKFTDLFGLWEWSPTAAWAAGEYYSGGSVTYSLIESYC
jgi:hypothetical protein